LPTELQLKQNPFTGNEKIKFKTNQSYMEFIGSGRKNYTKEWSVATCENQILGYDEMKFVGNNFEISMRIEGKQGFYDITIYDILQGINMFSNLKIDPTSGKLSEYNDKKDTLFLNSNEYYNVYKYSCHGSYAEPDISDSWNQAVYLYYSTSFGIVRVDFSDSTSWELESIEW